MSPHVYFLIDHTPVLVDTRSTTRQHNNHKSNGKIWRIAKMPRTRTKYIWPPPMLADDNTATLPRADTTTPTITNAATSEPRAKKPRLESASSTRRSTASGRNTPAREGYQNQDHSGQDKGKADEWDPYSGAPPPSVEAIFAAYARIPMDTQIKRYREWRRKTFPFCAKFLFWRGFD